MAVVVVSDGSEGGMMHAPVHGISPKLREQGILDSVLEGFSQRFVGPHKLTLGQLKEYRVGPSDSLYFTTPEPATGPDTQTILSALYKALVAPRSGGSNAPTKGNVLSQVVKNLRDDGRSIAWGKYVDDFIFDAVIEEERGPLLSVLSFATKATTQRSWEAVEKDAGHFLYALEKVKRPGLAVLASPTSSSHQHARDSFSRVKRWLTDADVRNVEPDHVVEAVRAIA